MSFLFINKTLRLNNLKTGAAINAKVSVFVVCVEAVINLLLYKLHDYTFNESQYKQCGVTPHFSTGQNLLKKKWEKINIDIINWEKLFDRSAERK